MKNLRIMELLNKAEKMGAKLYSEDERTGIEKVITMSREVINDPNADSYLLRIVRISLENIINNNIVNINLNCNEMFSIKELADSVPVMMTRTASSIKKFMSNLKEYRAEKANLRFKNDSHYVEGKISRIRTEDEFLNYIINNRELINDGEIRMTHFMQIDIEKACRYGINSAIEIVCQSMDYLREMNAEYTTTEDGKELVTNFLSIKNIPNARVFDYILCNGLVVNGVKFNFLGGTASQLRRYQYNMTSCTNVDEIRHLNVLFSKEYKKPNKIRFGGISKKACREFQCQATGRNVGLGLEYDRLDEAPEGFVPDYYYVFIKDSLKKNSEGKVANDGSGAANILAFKKFAKVLGEETTVVQGRPHKGTQQKITNPRVYKILKRENRYSDEEIRKMMQLPLILFTESQVKFNAGVPIYPYTILNYSHEVTLEDIIFTNYQMVNNLMLTEDENKKKTDDLFDICNIQDSDDPATIAEKLEQYISKIELSDSFEGREYDEGDESLLDALKLLKYNIGLAVKSGAFKTMLAGQMKNKIAKAANGKYPVKGNYCLAVPDISVLFDDDELLKEGEFFYNNCKGEVASIRFPYIFPSEAQILNLIRSNNPELLIHAGFNVIVYNAKDGTECKQQGADFDGDKFAIIFDLIIIDAVKRIKALNLEQYQKGVVVEHGAKVDGFNTNEIVEYNMDNIKRYYLFSYIIGNPQSGNVATVGILTNIATIIVDTCKEYTPEVCKKLAYLAKAINDTIDAVKTGDIPVIPDTIFEILEKGTPTFKNLSCAQENKLVWLMEEIDGKQYISTSPLGKNADRVRQIYELTIEKKNSDSAAILNILTESGFDMNTFDNGIIKIFRDCAGKYQRTMAEINRVVNTYNIDVTNIPENKEIIKATKESVCKQAKEELARIMIALQNKCKISDLDLYGMFYLAVSNYSYCYQVGGDYLSVLFGLTANRDLLMVKNEEDFNNYKGDKCIIDGKFFIRKKIVKRNFVNTAEPMMPRQKIWLVKSFDGDVFDFEGKYLYAGDTFHFDTEEGSIPRVEVLNDGGARIGFLDKNTVSYFYEDFDNGALIENVEVQLREDGTAKSFTFTIGNALQ